MREFEVALNPNKLVRFLKKPSSEFTRHDIIRFIEENGIDMVNFRFAAEDGKLKTINFVITSRDYLESILSTGERVDGSSLFSYIDAGSSDLYVIPRFSTAFVNPFSEVPSLDILCSFYTKDGKPLESSPDYILRKAHTEFKKETGMVFKAMGELEYYIVGSKSDFYPAQDQKGYTNSTPFAKWENLRVEAMNLIAQCGGKIKYGHCEVGNFTAGEKYFEQQEIEFQPTEAEDAADQLIIAKWILRNLGNKYGVHISFAPKITVGKAGSGMHIHMQAEKNGSNVMTENYGISDTARKIIAGLLDKAGALTAFGNTVPLSYLRLVPNQEAPTKICWGDTNRSALIRIPLGWVAETNMIKDANPFEKYDVPYIPGKQTIELRTPDGSADVYHLFAAVIMSALYGIQSDDALKKTHEYYLGNVKSGEDTHKHKNKFRSLPASCSESADELEKERKFFERKNIFPPGTVDRILQKLRSFDDKNLSEKIFGNEEAIRELVNKFAHHM